MRGTFPSIVTRHPLKGPTYEGPRGDGWEESWTNSAMEGVDLVSWLTEAHREGTYDNIWRYFGLSHWLGTATGI